MDVDRHTWGSTLVKNHDENKTYILVKVSESFSNTIQEYSAAHQQQQILLVNLSSQQSIAKNLINNNNNHHHHNNHHNDQPTNKPHNNKTIEAPTIKFHGKRGAIKFPNGKSYDFSLEQSVNSVECIKQTKNKWESVGKMACCLQVKGKDDVYQRTRTKMEAAEQEKRKYCTKLLGSPENDDNITTTTGSSSSKVKTESRTTSFLSTPAPTSLNNHHNHNNYNSHHKNNSSSNNKISNNNYNNSTGSNHKHNSLDKPSNNKSNTKTNNNSCSSGSGNNNTNNHSVVVPTATTAPEDPSNSKFDSVNQYPDITNVKQLKRYKADFDKDFKEYQHLHGYLHRIEERFSKLRESLKKSVEGSPEWESAKEQIFSEYERVKGDSNFHRARSKYKQLYSKLAHIKAKIFQFKRQNRDKFNHNDTIQNNKRRKR